MKNGYQTEPRAASFRARSLVYQLVSSLALAFSSLYHLFIYLFFFHFPSFFRSLGAKLYALHARGINVCVTLAQNAHIVV